MMTTVSSSLELDLDGSIDDSEWVGSRPELDEGKFRTPEPAPKPDLDQEVDADPVREWILRERGLGPGTALLLPLPLPLAWLLEVF